MVTELQLKKIRENKKREMEVWAINQAHNRTKRAVLNEHRGNVWEPVRQNISDFMNTFFTPKQTDDFPSMFNPSGNMMAASGTLTDDLPGFAQYMWLAEKRLGVCNNIASKPSEDAVRNRFRIAKYNGEVDEDKTEEIMDWLEDPELQFWNQLTLALYYERVYGISVMVKYYEKDDKESGALSEPAPVNKKPIALQAFPPTVMAPLNVDRAIYLDSDPREWDWHGGTRGPAKVHHSRCQVFRTRPAVAQWAGQSIFEAIWLQLVLYYEIFIFMIRHFTKWGNVVPSYLVDSDEDLDAVYNNVVDLVEEMKMNGAFVGRRGDEVTFAPTSTAQGLTEMMEIIKEEIAARTRIPVMVIFGRISNAGLGSAGYLLAQMEYWDEVSNIQQSISDEVLSILRSAGFELKKRRIDWILAINKTDQQRLIDEGMKIENEIMKETYVQTQLQTMMMLDQMEHPEKYIDENPTDNNGETPKTQGAVDEKKKTEKKVSPSEKDFIDRRDMIFEKIKAQRKVRIEQYLKNLEGVV